MKKIYFSILIALLAILGHNFAFGQACPDPGGGNRWFYFLYGNGSVYYPGSALPTGVPTGNTKAASGVLHESRTMNAVYSSTTHGVVTINPTMSDNTTGKVVLRFPNLGFGASDATIKIYQGSGTSGTLLHTIDKNNSATYLGTDEEFTGAITVAFDNPIAVSGGNFDIQILYTTGNRVQISSLGTKVAYWTQFISPNSYVAFDQIYGSAVPISIAYFDANKNYVASKSATSYCLDYGKSAPPVPSHYYVGQITFQPHLRMDVDSNGVINYLDTLKAARLLYHLNLNQNNHAPQGNVDAILSSGTYSNPNATPSYLVAAIPNGTVFPKAPLFSVTPPAAAAPIGVAQNFQVYLLDDRGNTSKVFKLYIPTGVTVNSVSGATYNPADSTLSFATAPAAATVNVTSNIAQTAALNVVYAHAGYYNFDYLMMYKTCSGLSNFQDFIGKDRAAIIYPHLEASVTWAAPTSTPTATVSYNCVAGTAGTVTATSPLSGGGTNYEYSINGTTWQTSTAFSGLTMGSYTLSVRDQASPSSIASTTVTVEGCVTLSGTVYNDANGNFVQETGEPGINAGGQLYVYLVERIGSMTTGIIIDSVAVAANGTFTLEGLTNQAYNIELSAAQYPLGINTGIMPIDHTLPSGWVRIGEGVGTIKDNNPNGIIVKNKYISGANINIQNFAIQRPPLADAKRFTVAESAFTSTPAGFPYEPGYKAIFASSTILTGYNGTGGSLSGSDPEDCPSASSCNSLTNTKFVIDSIYTNTKLFYNFGAVTGVQELPDGDTILNFDKSKLVIYGADGALNANDTIGFTYAIIDKANFASPAVIYEITTLSLAFSCNDSKLLYSGSPSGNTTLYDVAYSSPPLTRSPLGTAVERYNAIGFNTLDGFVYGIKDQSGASSNHLLRINADGSLIDLGAVTGLPTQSSDLYNTGDFDNTGHLYVMTNTSTSIYKIDVVNKSATAIALNPVVAVSDIAYHDGLFYGVKNSNSQLVSIDPATGTVVEIGSNHSTGVFGAMFGACNGVFGIANNGGFYQFDITTGTRLNLAGTPSALSGVDGAHCHTACIGTEPLPISLISFDAYKNGNIATLKWTTATEFNNKGFNIERSANGNEWRTIGTIESKATNGNSNQKLSYDFNDNSPLVGKNLYRLKQIDFDGKYDYSMVQTLNFENGLIEVYPNPTKGNVTISKLVGNENIELIDILGRKLFNVSAKSNTINIDLSNYAQGVYHIRIVATDGSTTVYKLVKQ